MFSGEYSSDSTTAYGSATAINSQLDISSSAYTAVEGKYVVLKWNPAATSSQLYGAKVTTARV